MVVNDCGDSDKDARLAQKLSLVGTDHGVPLVVIASSQSAARITEPHAHARGQIFGATRGLMTVTTDGGQWVVPPTHAVWVPPLQRHGATVHGAYEGWSAYLAPLECLQLPSRPFTMRASGLLREAVMRAADWDGVDWDESRSRLLGLVRDEVRDGVHEPLGLPMPQDRRALRIARAITSNPADTRSLEQLAHWAGMSSRTVTRYFVEETGFNFIDWRQRARLLKSLELIAAGQSVTSTALEVGYDNVSAFIAMFRRLTGVTPSRYFTDAVTRGGAARPKVTSARGFDTAR